MIFTGMHSHTNIVKSFFQREGTIKRDFNNMNRDKNRSYRNVHKHFIIQTHRIKITTNGLTTTYIDNRGHRVFPYVHDKYEN